MTSKQALYDNYVASGQAGVDPAAAHSSAQAKLAKGNPYLERLIKNHFPSDQQIRILDLGCGHGALLMLLKKHGYHNLAGVDTSPAQVALAHELGISEIQQGDALEFLDEQAPADVICCFDLLEHLTRDECSTLVASIAGKLTPGGTLLLHVPNGEGLFGQRIRYGDLTHETCFTPHSIRQLLTPLGFTQIRCLEDKPLPHGLVSTLRRVIWELGTLWSRFLLAAETGSTRFVLSQNMLVVAKK